MAKCTRRSVRRISLTGALVAVLAAFGLPALGASVANADPAAVRWGACDPAIVAKIPADQASKFSCATYQVPLDHDDATLGTIDIALLRRAAAKPDQKIGSLFVNPGGPGGPGLTMPVSASSFLAPEVLDRFDIIGFDPRGVGRSNPLRCFNTSEDAQSVYGAEVSVPMSMQEISGTLNSYRDYGKLCKANSGALLNHMSTKDVARDLDLLRSAVGDQKLNYVGFSYGTLIGATYANMFPKTTRSMVIDGNVDPELRTRDGLEYDRERAQGFEVSLNAFFDACKKAADQCAFSPGQPKDKFDEIRTQLAKQPVKLSDTTSVSLTKFISSVSGALYSPDSFRSLAADMQKIYDAIHPPAGAEPKKFTAEDLPVLMNPPSNARLDARQDSAYTQDDSYLAVNCLDKKFTNNQDQIPAIAAGWERESPNFGRTQAFSDPAACPVWPGKEPDVYRGPWNASTENPVVVVGNYYDPATRYSFAQHMANELGYSRLLSVDAFGHCVLGSSAGVDKAVSEYLIDLKAPAPAQVFQPNTQPFAPAPAAPPAAPAPPSPAPSSSAPPSPAPSTPAPPSPAPPAPAAPTSSPAPPPAR